MNAYIEAPLQLDKICRACLTQKSDMKPLYGACLYEMLNSCASIQAQHDDGLPSLLCVQCIWQCSRAHSFRQLCEKSDRRLRELIKLQRQAQLQAPVTLIEPKIEVDESCEVDHYAGVADVSIKAEIKPELVFFTDSDLKIEQHKGGADNGKPPQLVVRLEAHRAARPPPAPVAHERAPCGAIFSMKAELKAHFVAHSKDEATILEQHTLNFDTKPHQDDQSDRTKNSNLKWHTKMHSKVDRPHLCLVCYKTFKWASNLSRHRNSHTGDKLLCCNYCNKKFEEEEKLKIHLRSHTGERPYSCDICQMSFSKACNLKMHFRVHTNKLSRLCLVCGKGFTNYCHLNIHMRTHTGAKPYVCQTCEKSYATLYRLKVHQSVHTGEKSHKCKTCGKCFLRSGELIVHMRTHAGVKSHICRICGIGFITSSNLCSHMKTHAGGNHVCNTCGKKFRRMGHLKLHIETHLKQKEAGEKSKVFKKDTRDRL